ncbi:FAD-binding domain-containing protein [Immersiella caudata]|uniref:FAD-binding domain-containing protein n=1 Tax=Immersiella caudata TaxID=314043 RepID=A0AA39WG31_9PEZI|nr:FAD-binding domain-containing protein [Immersiella caudata]
MASCCHRHFVAANHDQYLTDEEIERFLDELDHNGDGLIDYDEVEQRLDTVHDELFPPATDKGLTEAAPETDLRHQFLRSIIGSDARRIPRAEFANRVREWKIPSLTLEQQGGGDYTRKMPLWRRIRAYWAVNGPEILFLALVISMQVAFGVWQLVKYADGGEDGEYVRAFGWGVVLAKTTAGALYPTMFFLVLSMSRYCSTFLRRSYCLSRFVNWDLSQSFHIKMSITAVSLATLHAIGHLTGTFNNGSQVSNDEYVDEVIGDDGTQRQYTTFLASLPGWTGLIALSLFYALGILSSPPVRRLNYEVFQLGHLLIYPLLGMLFAHGSDGMLQYPMLGYWLAFPTLMVIAERGTRLVVGFHRITARLRVLDGETVEVTANMPRRQIWGYRAGQYVLLQVPELSLFQWHPFTVSVCAGTKIQLHIKTDGNWTRRLRALADESGQAEIAVGINGPFGAPAQRFYDFSHTIVVGSGIGVTPFSGILSDLQARDNAQRGGPGHILDGKYMYSSESGRSSVVRIMDRRRARLKPSINKLSPPSPPPRFASDYRRVDFHWTVRERNYLLWMADLLNDVSRSQQWHRRHGQDGTAHLDIRINTHVTQRRSNIVAHVYCWLLEMYRTDSHPESPLTHLLNPTNLGRPDFVRILDQHYEDMLSFQASKRANREQRKKSEGSTFGRAAKKDAETHKAANKECEGEELRIGVFFCGTPVVGEILADRCRALTVRSQREESKIEYYFMSEVFS